MFILLERRGGCLLLKSVVGYTSSFLQLSPCVYYFRVRLRNTVSYNVKCTSRLGSGVHEIHTVSPLA